MTIRHHNLVEGNSLSFKGGFFGFSTVTLIESDSHGPILFDTGHHATRLLLLDALTQRGLSPQDIQTVFLSHLHFDHINNVDLFPNAVFYVGAAEWEYANSNSSADPFLSPATTEYIKQKRLCLIDRDEGELIPGLRYRFSPGHTPGSYLLHYIHESGDRIVLAADACKTYRELASLSVANEYDPEHRATKSLQWIADNADIVVPGHFGELRRTHSGWIWDNPTRLELIVR